MTFDYEYWASAKHEEYQRLHREWVKGLTPSQREKLAKVGADKPIRHRDKVNGRAPDLERDEEPSTEYHMPDMSEAIDTPAELLIEHLGLTPAQAAAVVAWADARQQRQQYVYLARQLQKIVGTILRAPNVRVSVAGLAYAADLDALNGLGSIQEFARKIGISPATISKAKVAWQDDLDLRPNLHGKSDATREALSAAQKEKHWRKKRRKPTT